MNKENAANSIGLALLAACFLLAGFRVFSRGADRGPDAPVVIRFAHWQLESGLRDSIDHLARAYEARHPGVKIEQIAIPQRTYEQWVKTQLIGETAPEIIQISHRADDETLARFFIPVGPFITQPNPYNAGTDLADVPWRDTFLDGMTGTFSYRPNLLDHYGIPLSTFTIRMYYNRDLWLRLFGDAPVPATFEEFLAVCEAVRKQSAERALGAIPIAGARETAPMLIDQLVASQTQRLVQTIDRNHILRASNTDIGLAFLRSEWTTSTPAFLDALAIARDVGLSLQPGYTQLGREDATFYFIQGRALMIATGSWDSPGLHAQCPFPLGVFEIPLPTAAHPRYGKNLLGRPSEADGSTGMAFAITRQTPHAAQALDFLHFLTSRQGNADFSRVSGWLPSVLDVEPPDTVKPFLPRIEGYVAGFGLNLGGIGSSSALVMDNQINVLVQPSGSVDKFRAALDRDLEPAIREDLGRIAHFGLINLTRQDIGYAGQLALHTRAPDDATLARKISELTESQNRQESQRAWLVHELARTAAVR